MPARRRRSLIRSAVQRAEMWDAKMKGDIYKIQLEAVKDSALRRVAAYQSMHEQLIATVKRIVAESPEPFLVQEYMWFAEKMLKLTQTYGDNALQREADALYLWYLARGRDDYALREVAKSLGINISPIDDILGRILPQFLIPLDDLKIALRSEVAPIREETVKVLDGEVVDPGGMAEFTVESFSRHSAVVVSVRASYHESATAGVRVRWLYSADNLSFDSVEDAELAGNYEDLSFAAGEVRQRTVLIPLFKPYVKIQIVNRDTSYPATISCWKTMLR
jgi:hypothetical protein